MANSRSNIYPVKLQGAERFLIKRKKMKIQILENESFKKYADFENCEVWILNRTNEEEIDARIINVSEITASFEPSVIKFPKLFTEVSNRHFKDGEIPENFEYEIITDSIEKYMVHSYVCDVEKINVVEKL